MPTKPQDSFFWKLDGALINALGFASLFAGVACIGWAALVLLAQVLGWIRAGEWQPVPLFSLFLSDAAQAGLHVYLVKLQPLDLVPSWGDGFGAEDISTQLAGQWIGMRKIMVWLLDCPLIAALMATSMAFFMGAGAAFSEANGHRR